MTNLLRLSLPAFLLAVSLTHVHAERKTVALGLVGGITAASFWGDQVKEFDTEIWPTTGFTLAFHLPAFLGLETDLLYVSKSGAIRTYEDGRTKVNTLKMHALEIPLMIKVTAPTGSEVMPIFFGGPSVAYVFSRKSYSEYIDILGGGVVNPEETPPLIKPEDMEVLDWSLCLGGGVEWGLGSFQLRCNFGNRTLDKSKQKDVKTVVLAVMAGFIF
ncbi:MAG TPA: porin family protein [Fibrobacteria bacterium]|nr:porin family protein [Fibrobacteria bacterium]